MFVLTFGQSHLPHEVELDMQKLQEEGTPIHVVTRLAVSPGAMSAFIQVMQNVYESWAQGRQPEDATTDEAREGRG